MINFFGKAELAEFRKSKIGIRVYLDYYTFEDENDILKKIIEITNLFSFEKLSIKGECFVYDYDTRLTELEKIIDCTVKTVFTKKRLFSKTKYNKVEIDFTGVQFAKFFKFALESNIAIGADCFDENEVLAVQIADYMDGMVIHYNTNKYDKDEINTKINQILNRKN